MKLIKYIEKYYNGNQSEFARAEGVSRQHVQKWVSSDWQVIGNQLVSQKRILKKSATVGDAHLQENMII